MPNAEAEKRGLASVASRSETSFSSRLLCRSLLKPLITSRIRLMGLADSPKLSCSKDDPAELASAIGSGHLRPDPHSQHDHPTRATTPDSYLLTSRSSSSSPPCRYEGCALCLK